MAFADTIRTARPTRENIADLIEQAGMGISNYCTSTSGTNTITATCSSVTAYATGQHYWFLPANNNTGAVTLNINSLGAKSVTTQNGRALVLNMLVANIWAHVAYNGTNLVLMNVQEEWADYTPTFGASAGTWTPGIYRARYYIKDNYSTVLSIRLSSGAVSSTPAYLTMTLPTTGKNITDYNQYIPMYLNADSGGFIGSGHGFVIPNSSVLQIYKSSLAAFTTANTYLTLSGEYEYGA
jgi:hypothetical protein